MTSSLLAISVDWETFSRPDHQL